jgi:thiamine-phosphate pyrophosphorylase
VCAGAVYSKSRLCVELYVIIDESLVPSRNIQMIFEEAVDGGADVVQFRAKRFSKRQYYETALGLLPIARHYNVPFFVNDHLDIALALPSDGIHLGQNDLPCNAARRLLPDKILLGVSTHSEEQAAKALEDKADYIAIGPVFQTTTKENPEAIVGTGMVASVKRLIGSIPLVAIGGINVGNAAEVIRSGADGVAVASSVVMAEDPRSAARRLKTAIREARECHS